MYEDKVESNASFIALPSDQLFDEIQASTSQKKRRTVPQLPADNDDSDGVEQLLKDIPKIGDNFTVISKIGTGTFSTVYLACLKKNPSKYFALKHIVETSVAWRIENELKCLTLMSDNDYIMSLETFVRHNNHIVLVMPFFDHNKFQDYVDQVSIREVQQYMKCLFTALKAVHSFHIIHRDIKPSNFLYNRKERKFKLVDFGLAQTEPIYRDQIDPSYKGEHHAILKGATNEAPVSSMMPSRAVRMSPRLAKKRNSQLRLPSTFPSTSSSVIRSCRKENTVVVTVSGGRSVTPNSQQPCLPTTSRGSRGRRPIVSSEDVASSTRRMSRRGSLRCNHSSSEVCNHCIQRSGQKSPRAGTPGFRPPEVLLKYPNQTTAVDVWSAGVILLCLLSGKYPFFKANDDLTAMMQIVRLMGSHECVQAAKQFGKDLTCSPTCAPQELSSVCRQLRSAQLREKISSVNTTEHSMDTTPHKHSTTKSLTSPIRNVTIELQDIRKLSSPASRVDDVKVKLEQVNDMSMSSSKDENVKLTFCRSCINRVEVAPMATHSLCSRCIERINKQCTKLTGKRSLALRKLPTTDDGGVSSDNDTRWSTAPDEAYDLLKRCLDLNPLTRITATDALSHPFLKDTG